MSDPQAALEPDPTSYEYGQEAARRALDHGQISLSDLVAIAEEGVNASTGAWSLGLWRGALDTLTDYQRDRSDT